MPIHPRAAARNTAYDDSSWWESDRTSTERPTRRSAPAARWVAKDSTESKDDKDWYGDREDWYADNAWSAPLDRDYTAHRAGNGKGKGKDEKVWGGWERDDHRGGKGKGKGKDGKDEKGWGKDEKGWGKDEKGWKGAGMDIRTTPPRSGSGNGINSERREEKTFATTPLGLMDDSIAWPLASVLGGSPDSSGSAADRLSPGSSPGKSWAQIVRGQEQQQEQQQQPASTAKGRGKGNKGKGEDQPATPDREAALKGSPKGAGGMLMDAGGVPNSPTVYSPDQGPSSGTSPSAGLLLPPPPPHRVDVTIPEGLPAPSAPSSAPFLLPPPAMMVAPSATSSSAAPPGMPVLPPQPGQLLFDQAMLRGTPGSPVRGTLPQPMHTGMPPPLPHPGMPPPLPHPGMASAGQHGLPGHPSMHGLTGHPGHPGMLPPNVGMPPPLWPVGVPPPLGIAMPPPGAPDALLLPPMRPEMSHAGLLGAGMAGIHMPPPGQAGPIFPGQPGSPLAAMPGWPSPPLAAGPGGVYPGGTIMPPALWPGAAPVPGAYPGSFPGFPVQPPPLQPPIEPPMFEELRKQIEFYFSDTNMERDFYLRRQMSHEGYVSLLVLSGFARVRQLAPMSEASLPALLMQALTPSFSVELDPTRTKVRRRRGWQRFVLEDATAEGGPAD